MAYRAKVDNVMNTNSFLVSFYPNAGEIWLSIEGMFPKKKNSNVNSLNGCSGPDSMHIITCFIYWSPILLTRAHARSISRIHGRLTASKHERDARVMMTWLKFSALPHKKERI